MLILDGKKIEKGDYCIEKATAVTLGNFDGIHIGHLKLIQVTKEYAKKRSFLTVMFSFYPHPVSFFEKDKPFYTILSREERLKEAERYGIDIFVEYPFSKAFASMEPDDFIKILVEKLKCRVLVVGNDYHFGKNRSGDFETLKKCGEKYGFQLIRIEKVEKLGERVSSTNIRKCIGERDLKKAEILLGKKYFVSGKVCSGNKIGRTIGFPTANIVPCNDKLLPPDGVYITTAEVSGKAYRGITNIGKNPTVNGTIKTVETFLFDFSEDIYDKDIKVNFCEFLREEVKFDGTDMLKMQLEKDKRAAEMYFENFTQQKGISE